MAFQQFDFQRGYCLDFALAFSLYLKQDKPRFTLLTATCRRGNILIHAYLESNNQFLDSKSVLEALDYSDIEDRLEAWLTLELELEGDYSAQGKIRSNLTQKQALKVANRHGYQTSLAAQQAALEYIKAVYVQKTN